MPVLMGAPMVRHVIRDTATLQLDGAWGLEIVTVGGRTFVHAAGFNDSGLTTLELSADGLLSPLETLVDDPSRKLAGAWMLASATLDGVRYLYAAGGFDDGLSAFRIEADGRLVPIQDVSDNVQLALFTPAEMEVMSVGDSTFLAVTGTADNGLSLFRVGSDGRLTPTATMFDTAETWLGGAWGLTSAQVGARSFLFASGLQEDGLNVFEVLADGRLVHRGGLADGSDPQLHLTGCFGLATARLAGQTFLIASSFVENGLSVFRVGADGGLVNVSNVADTTGRALGGVQGVTTFSLDGECFVASFAQNDSAIGLFHLGPDGVLSDVSALFDTSASALGATLQGCFAMLGDLPVLVASSFAEGGLTVLELGGGDDALTGGAGADLLLGLGGRDQLRGGAGADRLLGGRGDDVYWVDSLGDKVVEAPGAGEDTVRSGVNLILPPEVEALILLPGALEGSGNALSNRISGNADDNRILGGGGDDVVLGERGSDVLRGGSGSDRLHGGGGADVLDGGSGADRLLGGAGRDILIGGAGSDRFEFLAATDSGPTGLSRDTIRDFVSGPDKLVLTALDADPATSGDQPFRLDGGDAFLVGELRQVVTPSGLLLLLNLDADEEAEMSIQVGGLAATLGASNFEL
jgi:hypothetical protein